MQISPTVKARLRKIKRIVAVPKSFFMRDNSILLVDTPKHGNLGDHAIAIAERQYVKKIVGRKPMYELTAGDFDIYGDLFAKHSPMNQTILVPGGGFLGALWPIEEYRFREILNKFSKQKIIVFPQTIYFDLDTEDGKRFFDESKTAYESHPDLTIVLREKQSFNFMQQNMSSVHCVLAPDIALLLELSVPQYERKGILMCMRSDLEKAVSDSQTSLLVECLKQKYPTASVTFTDTVVDHKVTPFSRKREVRKKLVEFSKAELVVTDRLHGMIFCAITGTPCIAMSNLNKKVKLVYEWIENLDYVKFVENTDEFRNSLENINLNCRWTYDPAILKKYFSELTRLLHGISDF